MREREKEGREAKRKRETGLREKWGEKEGAKPKETKRERKTQMDGREGDTGRVHFPKSP